MEHLYDGSLQSVRSRIAKQPFSQMVGAEVVGVTENGCELFLPLREDLTQHMGFMHGGAICFVADTATTIAGAQGLQGPVVTSEIHVKYVRPGIGEAVIARAECLHAGRTQATSRCNIYVIKDGVEKLCALAQATIVKVDS